MRMKRLVHRFLTNSRNVKLVTKMTKYNATALYNWINQGHQLNITLSHVLIRLRN